MVTNKDVTLYDIIFTDEIREEIKRASYKFSDQVQDIIDAAIPYYKTIYDSIKLKNTPYQDWSSSASIVEILKEAPSDLFVVKEIEEKIYQAFINAPIGGDYI